jgi:hypothetical protein
MPSDESKHESEAKPEPKAEPRPEPRPEREHDPSVRQRLEALIPDLVRRTISSGLGAVLTGEESIQKLPASMASYFMQTAQSTKEEIVRIVAREVHDFLTSARVHEEFARLLTQLALEVKMEIRFLPVAGAADVAVKSEVKKATVRRVEDPEDEKA